MNANVREIFKDIYNDEIDTEDKLMAVQAIAEAETHNSITKADILQVLRWMLETCIF